MATRIIPIETKPEVISELCAYDRNISKSLGERAMRVLDMITSPKIPGDDTSTALGFLARIYSHHPSSGIVGIHDGLTWREALVRSSNTAFQVEPDRSLVPLRPDGVYTLIPA
jgi:hypothetical protein